MSAKVVPPPTLPVAIGTRFKFIDVEMICVGHQVAVNGTVEPGIESMYVAKDGTFHVMNLCRSGLDALRCELKAARKEPKQ